MQFLDSVIPWGKQHVYLFKGPVSSIANWRKGDWVSKLVKKHRLAKYLNATLPLVMPEKMKVSSIQHDSRRLRVSAVTYSPQAFEARIQDRSNHILLVERTGCLLAYSECRLTSEPPVPSLRGGVELVRLYVQRNCQRLGLGTALLARAEAHARALGRPLLWLTAWVGNGNARTLYLARGYAEVGRTTYVFEGQAYENRLYSKSLETAP